MSHERHNKAADVTRQLALSLYMVTTDGSSQLRLIVTQLVSRGVLQLVQLIEGAFSG